MDKMNIMSEGQESKYVQDLKTRTVPNGIWYLPSQAIVLHITGQVNTKLAPD